MKTRRWLKLGLAMEDYGRQKAFRLGPTRQASERCGDRCKKRKPCQNRLDGDEELGTQAEEEVAWNRKVLKCKNREDSSDICG